MCAVSRPRMSRSVRPSASRRIVSSAAAELVSSSLRSTAVPHAASRPPAVRRAGASAPALTAGLQEQCEGRAGGDGAAGERDELGRDRLAVDDRVAPVVEADVLGEQLGAERRGRRRRSGRRGWSAACVTRPPGAAVGSGIDGACIAVQRPASVAVELVREDASSALPRKRAAPSGWRQAPRPVTSAPQRARRRAARRGRARAARQRGRRRRRSRAGRRGTGRTGRRSRRPASPGREPTPGRRTARRRGPRGRRRRSSRRRGSGSPSLSVRSPHVLRVEPVAAVAADEQRLRALGDARRRGASRSASGLPSAIS